MNEMQNETRHDRELSAGKKCQCEGCVLADALAEIADAVRHQTESLGSDIEDLAVAVLETGWPRVPSETQRSALAKRHSVIAKRRAGR